MLRNLNQRFNVYTFFVYHNFSNKKHITLDLLKSRFYLTNQLRSSGNV